jgi:hypothetical protein
MSLLTYGIIGDRLSDLVAELREFDEVSNPDIHRVILNLSQIREDCDRRSLAILIPREDVPFPGLEG